jgi:nicotinamide mononucleotide transporter
MQALASRAMNTLEWVAAGLGVINVGLLVRRSIWNYPFGLAMVTLYFFVFYEAKLYSDMLLQPFFFVVQLYGWWSWIRAKQAAGEVQVGLLSMGTRLLWGAGIVAASLAWGMAMHRFTDAAYPFIDAFVAGASVAAQILLARRKLENWVLWIVVDMVAIGLYWSRDLHYTSGLYGLLLLLSIAGFIDWRRKLAAQGRPA